MIEEIWSKCANCHNDISAYSNGTIWKDLSGSWLCLSTPVEQIERNHKPQKK